MLYTMQLLACLLFLSLVNVECATMQQQFQALMDSVKRKGDRQFSIIYVKRQGDDFNFDLFRQDRILINERNKYYQDDRKAIMASFVPDPAHHAERHLLVDRYQDLLDWVKDFGQGKAPTHVDFYIFTFNSPCCRTEYSKADVEDGKYKPCTKHSCVQLIEDQIGKLKKDAGSTITLHTYLSWFQPYINDKVAQLKYRNSHQGYFTALDHFYTHQKTVVEEIFVLGVNDWFQKKVVDQLVIGNNHLIDIPTVNEIIAYCIMKYNGTVGQKENVYESTACWREALTELKHPKLTEIMAKLPGIPTGKLGPPINPGYTQQSDGYDVYSHDARDLRYILTIPHRAG